MVDPRQRIGDRSLRLLPELTPRDVNAGLRALTPHPPEVNDQAISGLKFSAALPAELARDTVAARLADHEHAGQVATEPRQFHLGRAD
ncbi:hypothetical protein [Amycolatopsis aidingensis]|uniref:hypothetical protein n=1 Tax=Amycolatopsis aidingensis TaxID=2842453 RepID=UPI001C0CDD8C|nr:hypothetical protein [Amycolatopsis aidingensis]